jgi:hypothetical protein
VFDAVFSEEGSGAHEEGCKDSEGFHTIEEFEG